MNPSSNSLDTLIQDPAMVRWTGHMTNGFGTTNGADPVAVLAANADEIILAGPLGTFRLPRAAIKKIGRASLYPWLFNGVRIHHGSAQWPEDLQFKPIGSHPEAIRAQLKGMGFPVA